MKVDIEHLIAGLHLKASAMHAMADHLNDLKKRKMIKAATVQGKRASMKEAKPDEQLHDVNDYGKEYSLDDYGASEYADFFHLNRK